MQVVRGQLRVVVLGAAGRPSRAFRISGWLLGALTCLLALPLGTGVLLGARHASAQRTVPWLTSDPLAAGCGDDLGPVRRAPYVVLARSVAPLPEEPELLVPPAPPEPVLGLTPKTPEHRRGRLRLVSFHHNESIDVVPWNERGERDEAAFAAVANLFRCRVTNHEVEVNERLVKLLTQLGDLYDKPLWLISGHRTPFANDTSPTSEHTLGTAADVRVPGVSIDELRAVALELGARGVGLYTEKQFVHIDFRERRKYQWNDVSEAHAGLTLPAAHSTP